MKQIDNRTSNELASENGLCRLLLISCSQRKRRDPGLLPAINRYDGPAFQVLRRYLRTPRHPQLQVYVLSAEFGVISSHTPIPYYNRRMTIERARHLREKNTEMLESILGQQQCMELFICASMAYQEAVDQSSLECLLPVRLAARGQGPKLASLHRWLRERSNG